jgi:uncharacterized protein YegJ (DUF2314 family)
MSDSIPATTEPIVTAISRNDPEMKAAYRKASQSMADFVSHLTVGDGRWCSAKLCFKDPDESDRLGEDRLLYWWLEFASYHAEEGLFSAEFTELPSCLEPYHHIGQRLTFEGEDIFDWRVNTDGRLYGGFTIRVARQRLPEDEIAEYDRYIGVSEYLQETVP